MSLVKSCFTHKLVRKQNNTCPICANELVADGATIVCAFDESELIELAGCHSNLYWVYEKYWEDWLHAIHPECYEIAFNTLCIKEIDDEVKRKIAIIQQNLSTSLGVKTLNYEDTYNPTLLTPIPRSIARDGIGYENIFFKGLDVWNAWEVSWLDRYGRPKCAVLKIGYDSDSKNIIESKSFKLYLNSFNNTVVDSSLKCISQIIRDDVQKAAEANIVYVDFVDSYLHKSKEGYTNIDDLYVPNEYAYCYEYDAESLLVNPVSLHDRKQINVYSSLLKSNCRHSGLPDWAELYLSYMPSSSKLSEESFLKYIVSFRNHQEFHEECCERIFYDLVSILNPIWIKLELNYTRRGGLDINPIRIHDIAGEYGYSFNKEYTQFKRTFRQ